MKRKRFRTILTAARIRRLVAELAQRVDEHYGSVGVSEIVIVCVMNASFMFCADLVRRLQTPSRVLFVQARSYQGTRKGGTVLAPIAENLRDRHVLVVDTIFDTGKTIERVVREVRKQTKAVEVAVLVVKHRKSDRRRRAAARFQGIALPGDPFLIGYGLDLAGEYRALKDICELVDAEA
jgi:hypoxanthine phosphoribosyltransferase